MILSRLDIERRLQTGEVGFDPGLDGFQMQPHAVDLRLGLEFHIPKTWELTNEGRRAISIDPLSGTAGKNFDTVKLKPGQYFELLPQESVIGTTFESISLKAPDLMCVLYPRSSINRRGLSVALSGIIDVGYCGHLMIPIVNNTDQQLIRIYPGERVCQVVFQKISSDINEDDAQLHGLTRAKYKSGEEGFIGGKSDREDETRLIREGRLDELKQDFAFTYDR